MTKEELIKQRNEIELQIAEIEAEERRKTDAEKQKKMQEKLDRIAHIAELVREFNADYDTKYKLINTKDFRTTFWF